jgi:hypothetical protein
MLALVKKTMQSDAGTLQAGDTVDVSTWRNVKSLISNRYIELIHDAPAPKAKKAEEPKVEESKAEKEEAKVAKPKATKK